MLISVNSAKRALEETQRRVDDPLKWAAAFTEHLPIPIFELSTAGQLIYANAEWRAFSGCAPDALSVILHPDDHVAYCEALSNTLTQGAAFRLTIRKMRHDGVWRKIRDDVRPLVHDGRIAGFAGCSTDVTEEIETRETAFKLGAEIQSAFRQRDVLTTEVHHRVKNNLQAILSMIGLHARRITSEEAGHDLGIVVRRIHAMATIQQELHDDTDVSRIDLLMYVRRVVEALSRLHDRADVRVQVNGDWADVSISTAAAVGAILAELIANCFDHGVRDGEGEVVVSMRREGGRAVLDLVDSGPGYTPAIARKDGIGLFVVERIARHSRIGLLRGEGPGMPWRLTAPLQE
jgi:PAS domain S-box-containing protein